jgi:uncharacterized protein
MPRPKCCRRIHGEPNCRIFKPVGIPVASLEEVVLSMDEFEAIRLAELEHLYHEQAAEKMGISRQTFGRIIEVARNKVARVLTEGLALRIEENEVQTSGERTFRCFQCQHSWRVPDGMGIPAECPACKSADFPLFEEQQGNGKGNPGRRSTRCRRT